MSIRVDDVAMLFDVLTSGAIIFSLLLCNERKINKRTKCSDVKHFIVIEFERNDTLVYVEVSPN